MADTFAELDNQHSMIDVSCLICGRAEADTIVTAAEIERQQTLLRTFHRHRRRHAESGDLTDRADFTQDEATSVVECRSCRFVFRTPRPCMGAVTETYEDDRYSEAHLQAEFLSQKRSAEEKVATLARWLSVRHTPVVVEVGSFVGGFLAAGQARGWSMLGVDPGKTVTEFCRDRGLPVFCGTLADALITPESVDAVAVWNTFDQLPNPDTTIAAARQALRENGVLVIRVPNGQFYRRGIRYLRHRRLFQKWIIAALAWNNLLAFPYLHGYSVSTLDTLLSRHGFCRRMIHRDTLATLAEEKTKGWAVWEERGIKWCCRSLSAAESLVTPDDPSLAPWLDVYYGLSEDIPATPLTLARVPRVQLPAAVWAQSHARSSAKSSSPAWFRPEDHRFSAASKTRAGQPRLSFHAGRRSISS